MSINKGLFSSNSSEWETPINLFNELDREFNFTLDACATEETTKCTAFYSKENNGLVQSWGDEVVFVNPPYGREISKWVKKSYEEYLKGSTVVMLIPARTDTKYFHDYIYNIADIRFLKGRLKFSLNGQEMGTAPFPSMVVIYKKKSLLKKLLKI